MEKQMKVEIMQWDLTTGVGCDNSSVIEARMRKT
jgi:hypothetical protein